MRGVLIALAVLAGLFALIRHFPLSWASAMLPGDVAELSGTVWDGQASNIPLLGDLSVKGRLGYVQLETPPGEVTLSGDVSPRGVTDFRLSMPVSRLPMTDARLSGLSGRVSLQIDEARIDDGSCVSASGTASTNILAANQARFDWAGPDLSGPVDCVDGRLRVRLSGQTNVETVNATILTGLDGVYQTDIEVETRDPAAENALVLFGFSRAADGSFQLTEQGRWR